MTEQQDRMLQIDLCDGQVRVMLCDSTATTQRCADIHGTTPVCTAALGRLITGTAMLGISKPVIKAHGSSDARAIRSAIKQAIDFCEADVIGAITENIEHMRVSSGQG